MGFSSQRCCLLLFAGLFCSTSSAQELSDSTIQSDSVYISQDLKSPEELFVSESELILENPASASPTEVVLKPPDLKNLLNPLTKGPMEFLEPELLVPILEIEPVSVAPFVYTPIPQGHIMPGAEIAQIAALLVQDPAILRQLKQDISSGWATCAAAAKNIKDQSEKLRASTVQKSVLNDIRVASYLEHCFKSVYSDTQSNLPSGLKERLAILKKKDDKFGQSLCTAFFLTPTRIATARHCFFVGGLTRPGLNSRTSKTMKL